VTNRGKKQGSTVARRCGWKQVNGHVEAEAAKGDRVNGFAICDLRIEMAGKMRSKRIEGLQIHAGLNVFRRHSGRVAGIW
jgi:hypothetical protein